MIWMQNEFRVEMVIHFAPVELYKAKKKGYSAKISPPHLFRQRLKRRRSYGIAGIPPLAGSS
jgi:hypothetical protein